MSHILIEEENPYGNAGAFVEDDGRTVYLYRVPAEGSVIQPSAVWVRNLLPAPTEADDAPVRGMAPLMKADSCNHAGGSPALQSDELDLIWFPDGTGVTLYVNGEVEAVLPPWAGHDFVQGYAREARGYEASTIPLPPGDSGFHTRLEENREFWNRRTRKGDWEEYRDRMLAYYESFLGRHSQYFAVDQKIPLLGIVQFNDVQLDLKRPTSTGDQSRTVLVTLGMGRQPQPGIEMYHENPDEILHSEILTFFPGAPDFAVSLLGRIAAYPWKTGRFFDHGHIYESGRTESVCDFLITAHAADAGWPVIPTAPLHDDRYPIRMLYAVPATQEDVLVARARGVDFRLQRMFDR